MEALNLSYDEVMNMPYSLLLMMQKDKIRPDYGREKEKTTKVSGKDMLQRKKRK